MQFLNASVPWPYPSDGADTFCRCAALPAMDRGEEWHWTLRLRASPDEIIGLICLTKGGIRVIAVEEADYVGGRFPTEIREITDREWRAFRGRAEAENRHPREKDASESAARRAD